MGELVYQKGRLNVVRDKEQLIRLSEGCPNDCEFCRETRECGKEPVYLDPFPEIVRNKVKILDMNLLYKDHALGIIRNLGSKRVNGRIVRYELVCGVDFRFMSEEKAVALKKNRFFNIRFAWDFGFNHQYDLKKCVKWLVGAGYRAQDLCCFMICDWKIPYDVCLRKLDLLKVWGVQVSDCWFNGVVSPNFQCNYWSLEQCKDFRRRCRKHNQMILFGIDPEFKIGVDKNGFV